jgi:hypothetical protein
MDIINEKIKQTKQKKTEILQSIIYINDNQRLK